MKVAHCASGGYAAPPTIPAPAGAFDPCSRFTPQRPPPRSPLAQPTRRPPPPLPLAARRDLQRDDRLVQQLALLMEHLQHRMHLHDDLPLAREDHHGHKPAKMVLSLSRAWSVVAKGLGRRSHFRRAATILALSRPSCASFLANPRGFSAGNSPAERGRPNQQPKAYAPGIAAPHEASPQGGGPTISPRCQPWENNPPIPPEPCKGGSTPAPARPSKAACPSQKTPACEASSLKTTPPRTGGFG